VHDTGGIQAQVMSAAETALWTRRRETTRDEIRAALFDLIVYGPPRGSSTTFVRVDQWLPAQPRIGVAEARAELCRRFLSAFGPADAHDFAKWSGLKTSDARIVLTAIADELVHVSVAGAPGWIRRTDQARLTDSVLDEGAVRLLGPFDSFLLAHATKEHLVEAKHYKRVYRPQGWISPVVLRGGAIVGVWFPGTTGKTMTLNVEVFGRVTAVLREGVEREAAAMGRFLGVRCDARLSSG
jgi:uncharacterized protein YcaQ